MSEIKSAGEKISNNSAFVRIQMFCNLLVVFVLSREVNENYRTSITQHFLKRKDITTHTKKEKKNTNSNYLFAYSSYIDYAFKLLMQHLSETNRILPFFLNRRKCSFHLSTSHISVFISSDQKVLFDKIFQRTWKAWFEDLNYR